MNRLKILLFCSVLLAGCSRQFFPGVYREKHSYDEFDFRPDGTYYRECLSSLIGELKEWSVGSYEVRRKNKMLGMRDSLYLPYAIPISMDSVRNDLADGSRTLYFDQRIDTIAWQVIVDDSLILRIHDYKVEIPSGMPFDHFYLYCYDEFLVGRRQQILKTKVHHRGDSDYNKYYVRIPDYALSYKIIGYRAPLCHPFKIKRNKLVRCYCNGMGKTVYKRVKKY